MTTWERKFIPTQTPAVDDPIEGPVKPGEADLRESSIETLGQYMTAKSLTPNQQNTGPQNKFVPNPMESGVSKTSINDDKANWSISPVSEPFSFFGTISKIPTPGSRFPGGTDPIGYFETIDGGGDPNSRAGGTFTWQDLSRIIDKNGEGTAETAKDGHEVLMQMLGDAWTDTFGPPIENPEDNNPVREGVSNVLRHNRFMPRDPNRAAPPFDPIGVLAQPNNPYIVNKQYSNGMYSLQRSVGRYDATASKVAMAEIAKIGAALMLQGAGAPANQTDPALGNAKSRQMGTGMDHKMMGIKIPVEDIMAKNVKGAPNPLSNDNLDLFQKGIVWNSAEGLARKPKTDGNNSTSYGHLNSYLEQFGGALPTSMILLSVLSATILAAIGVAFSFIVQLIFFLASDSKTAIATPEPYPLGARKGQLDFGDSSIGEMIQEFLRIPTLNGGGNYITTFLYGILSFYFRITDIGSAAYFLVINRVVIRDSEQIFDAFNDFGGGDLIGGIEGIFTILEAFATSATVQFVNTITMIGDITYLSGDAVFGDGSMLFSPYGNANLAPDFLPPRINNIHMKSRTLTSGENPDYRLAWRFGSLPSKYLLPYNIITANYALGRLSSVASANNISNAFIDENAAPGGPHEATQKNKFGSFTAEVPRGYNSYARNRVNPADRMIIEEALDAYYMPFYFHDLRTDEIIALHAFVDSFSDSFSPSYNSVSGIGRMDPVQIYKGTTRSMSLSFFMVATNPEDLSELYYSINKLVTLVYPQWSKGRTITNLQENSPTFTMPFSQIPTASPMIRMRVGDLWSSNYSTNTLSRLFGLGTETFSTQGETSPYPGTEGINNDLEEGQEKTDNRMEHLARNFRNKIKNWDHPPTVENAILENATVPTGVPGVGPRAEDRGIPIGTPVLVKPSLYPVVINDAANLLTDPSGAALNAGFRDASQNFLLKSNSGDVEGTVVAYHIASSPVGGFLNGLDIASKNPTYKRKENRVRYIVKIPSTGLEPEIHLVCGQYDLKLNLAQLVFRELNQGPPNANELTLSPETASADFEHVQQNAQHFFNAANNSIVRSFESTGGKGIAGHITALDFDWNLAPWDERPGSRAPTYCRVSIGFAPIHDIPLGLDHEGGIRAPAYNVGDLVRNIFGQGSLQNEIRDLASNDEGLMRRRPPADQPKPAGFPVAGEISVTGGF